MGIFKKERDIDKNRIKKWIKNHSDVFKRDEDGTTHWWYVQNLLGDLEFDHSEINKIKDEATEEEGKLTDPQKFKGINIKKLKRKAQRIKKEEDKNNKL